MSVQITLTSMALSLPSSIVTRLSKSLVRNFRVNSVARRTRSTPNAASLSNTKIKWTLRPCSSTTKSLISKSHAKNTTTKRTDLRVFSRRIHPKPWRRSLSCPESWWQSITWKVSASTRSFNLTDPTLPLAWTMTRKICRMKLSGNNTVKSAITPLTATRIGRSTLFLRST